MIGDGAALNLALAGCVIGVIFVMQVSLKNVAGGILARGAIFIAIWVVGLGVGGLLGQVDWALVAEKPWFAWPKLFPYGGPGFGWEFSVAAVLAILAGYLGSMVESLGDYAATCAVADERFTVRHMNRGIFAEGLGSVVAAVLGGLPCTSYTQNIGIIAATRVASRYVVQVAAVILMLYGLCPKFGALLVAMPRAVLGGVFVIVCGMIALAGIKLVGTAKTTTANFLMAGTSLICAVLVPIYVQQTLGEAWLATQPMLFRLVLTNTVVLAVILAVGLHLVLNILLKGDAEEDEDHA
jgi:uracil permease